MKTVIQIVLVVVILVLGYFMFESIAKPIRFEKEKKFRYSHIIERLKDIRTAQFAYKEVYGKYTGNFDTLINFLKYDSMPVVRAIGNVPDTLTEAKALELGLIIRDTIKIHLLDTLFGRNYALDSLKFVPFTNAQFKIQSGEIETGSNVKVKVFEVTDSKPFDPSHILKVGSMTEAITTGNWE